MLLAFECLKRILPELNEAQITLERLFQVLEDRGIEIYDLPYKHTNGAYITHPDTKKEYVILKRGITELLFHETLALEGTHALIHCPAPFLLRKQKLEAETFALIAMMPLSDLPRLNRIKHQLDDESYDLLMRRNKANEIWHL